jgi:anaerobic magnesium-protoporphyrin IX monomethyl ester cyclase
MLRLGLLNPPGELRDLESNLPPLGLGYIASYLRKYYVKIDIKIFNNLEEIIRFKPDIIGITGYTQNFEIVKKMIVCLKQELDVPIIIGGHHITTVPQNLPEMCDIGVIGEGEETVHQLLLNYERFGFSKESLKSVRGIVFKDSSLIITEKRDLIEPLDKIPFPARDLFELKTDYTHIMTSRGCPYRCIFCSSSIFWNKVRMFTPEYVVNEIEHITNTYHINHIWMYDDIFILNKERVEKISDLIEQKNFNSKVSFSVQARVNLISDEICQFLKKMNVTGVSFGFESGSDNILQSLKGGNVSITKAKKAIQLCKKYGFSISGGFIIGSPNETRKDILDSIKFYKDAPIGSTQISVATPLPGTYLWDYAMK